MVFICLPQKKKYIYLIYASRLSMDLSGGYSMEALTLLPSSFSKSLGCQRALPVHTTHLVFPRRLLLLEAIPQPISNPQLPLLL